jgi:hypothetical protein
LIVEFTVIFDNEGVVIVEAVIAALLSGEDNITPFIPFGFQL